MRNKYDKPIMDIIELSENVICTSGGLKDGTPTDVTGGNGNSVNFGDLFNGGSNW